MRPSVVRPVRRLAPLFALLLAAGVVLTPRPAAAELSWSWFAEKVVSSLISQAMGQACGYAFPQQGTDLSNASLTEIQSMITSALTSVNYSTSTTNYNGAVAVWYNYYRGTTLTSLQNNIATLKNGSAFDTYMQNALSSMQTCGFSCAKMYVSLGQIYVAAQIELYNVMKAINSLAGGTYGSTDLANQLALAQTEAATILKQIMTYKTSFENQFGSVSYSCAGWGSNKWFTSKCPVGQQSDRSCHYCLTYTSAASGSSQTLCPTSDLSWSSGRSDEGYGKEYKCKSTGSDTPSYWGPTCDGASSETACKTLASAIATVWRKEIIAAARDDQLGSFFYEGIAALQKITNKDVAYCGDGTCQIGETRFLDGASAPWCSDCTSSNYARLTSLSMTRPASRTTLLSVGGYNLNVNQYGDLLIQDSANSTYYWQTRTGDAGGNGYKFSLQSDGNLVIYDSSNTALWASDTETLDLTTDPPTVNTMTLIDGVLYLTDQYGNVWWESDTDHHVHGAISDSYSQPRQCWTQSSSAQTLAENSYYSLQFSTGGALQVTDGSTTLWSSSTSGYKACNEEDGNFVIYDSSRNQLWSSSTGTGTTSCSSTSTTATGCSFGGYGGDLALDGPQLRLYTPAGDPNWAIHYCSGGYSWACSKDNAVAGMSINSTSDTCWTSATTLLSNDYAQLDWTSSGSLVLYDKTPKLAGGTSNIQLWSKGTSGTKVCYSANGNLLVYYTTGGATSTLFSASVTSLKMLLAGCNLVLSDTSTGYAKYSSKTACTYGSKSTVWGGY